jgi:hypothetical protein
VPAGGEKKNGLDRVATSLFQLCFHLITTTTKELIHFEDDARGFRKIPCRGAREGEEA